MKLSKAEKMFLSAYHHNWDGGVAKLSRMLSKPDCDKATALLIYWHASPAYYNQYDELVDVPEHELPVYKLIKKIETLIRDGNFSETITFTAPADRIPKVMGHIPALMLEATQGAGNSEAILHGDENEKRLFQLLCDGDLPAARIMFESEGFDVNEKLRGYTPLSVACSRGHTLLLDYLVSRGASWKKKFDKAPLLHAACTPEGVAVLDALLALGAKIDAKGMFGRTALHNAVHWEEQSWLDAGMSVVVTALLERGADLKICDSDGKLAMDLCVITENSAAQELLRSAG